MNQTQMLLKCFPVWPLCRRTKSSENLLPKCFCMLKQSKTFVVHFDVSQFGHNVGQQFNSTFQIAEVNMRSVECAQCTVQAKWPLLHFWIWIVWTWKLLPQKEKIMGKKTEMIGSLGSHVSESMPWFWSPFSNFNFHLKLPVTASKLQLSFILPYFSSHCVKMKYGADQIWRALLQQHQQYPARPDNVAWFGHDVSTT